MANPMTTERGLWRSGLFLIGLLAGSAEPDVAAQTAVLNMVADVPLPGGTGRFDYQSLDPETGRLHIAHMGSGRLVVVDTKAERVVASLPGYPRVTGVLVVPSLNRVYASVTGRHELVVLDASTLRVRARLGPIRFPDGIAYALDAGKLFVSDEHGRSEIVVDTQGDSIRGRIPLGGEAGNTQYDSVGKRIFVAVQTRNQLVAIDPVTERIVGRYDLAGANHPHGLYVDAPNRLAFVACEGNARLLVLDLRTMRVTESHRVGEDPDVLAFDPSLRRLYVASESGVVTVFQERAGALDSIGEYRAPAAHSVAVDPISHRVYLPLKDLGGRPMLRILSPGAASRNDR